MNTNRLPACRCCRCGDLWCSRGVVTHFVSAGSNPPNRWRRQACRSAYFPDRAEGSECRRPEEERSLRRRHRCHRQADSAHAGRQYAYSGRRQIPRRAGRLQQSEPYLFARVEEIEEPWHITPLLPRVQALLRQAHGAYEQFVELAGKESAGRTFAGSLVGRPPASLPISSRRTVRLSIRTSRRFSNSPTLSSGWS